MQERFRVVFKKLTEASRGEEVTECDALGTSDEELDEIRELCRLASLVRDPEPTTYTGT